MRTSKFGRNAFLVILGAVCLWFFVWPAVMLLAGSLRTKAPGLPGASWGTDAFVRAYSDPATYATMLNSFVLAVSTAVIATLLSCALAFLATRTNVPLRRWITPMMFIVLLTPPLFFAFSWAILGNVETGAVNRGARAVLGESVTLVDVYSMGGMVFVMSLKAASFGYFLLMAPFSRMSRELEEASFLAGAGKARTFFGIDLPVLAPSMLGVLILQIVLGLEAFDVPLLLGLPGGIRVFSSRIYRYISDESPPGYAEAAALALVLLVVVVLLVFLESRLLRGHQFTTVTGKAGAQGRWSLGGWTVVATIFIALFGLLAVLLPILQIVLGSMQPVFGVTGRLTFEHFGSVLADERTVEAIVNTVLLATFGGLLAVAITLLVMYTARVLPGRSTKAMTLSTWVPWALPGVVLALGVAWAYLAIPPLRSLYGTFFMMLSALVVATVPIAGRAINGSLAQVSPDLEEAARLAGAGPARTFKDSVLPIVAPGLIGGWLVCAVLIAGRLDVPLILRTSGGETVSVLAYQLYTQGQGASAAALLVVTALFLLIPLGVLAAILLIGMWLVRTRRGRWSDDTQQAMGDGEFRKSVPQNGTNPNELDNKGRTSR